LPHANFPGAAAYIALMTHGPLSGSAIGRYQLRDLLGAGGMGVVYEAWDPALERPLVLKLLDPSLTADPRRVERFRIEARAASALTHPSIVTVYEVGEAAAGDGERVDFIAMELVEGRSLREWLDSRPSLTAILTLLARLAEGIAAAHRAGVVHRDLKPDNVMVVAGGLPKILDFGVAKLTEVEIGRGGSPADRAALTRPATILGTVGYMSPEQVEGLPIDHRSDVFSIGCILYECLTGREAFPGSTVAERLHATVHIAPQPLPPPLSGLQRIVNRCLAKEREARYDSARDLAFELSEAAGGAEPPAAQVPVSARPRRRRLLLAFAVLALLLISVVTVASIDTLFPDERNVERLEQSLASEREKSRQLAEQIERQRIGREQDERLRSELEQSYRELIAEVREHVRSDATERTSLEEKLKRTDSELANYRLKLTQREKTEQLGRLARELGSYADTRLENDRLIVTFTGSHFRPGRSAIGYQAHPILRYLAQEVRQKKDIRIDIEGHTDTSGRPSQNLTLSHARAAGVGDILVAAGVEAERISAIGRGDVFPAHDNSTQAGRELNRRVELSIYYEPASRSDRAVLQ
jgi:serine/threonine protein kinase